MSSFKNFRLKILIKIGAFYDTEDWTAVRLSNFWKLPEKKIKKKKRKKKLKKMNEKENINKINE